MPDSNWLLAEHQRRNQTTLNACGLFDAHRHRVMHLLKQAVGDSNQRLCVLGAGNCNDIELSELLNLFEEIVLVDLDRSATEVAVACCLDESLRSHVRVTGLDVSGIFERLQAADIKDFNSNVASDLLALLAVDPQIPTAPFDCMVSTCLMSQLIDSVILALGTSHPSVVPVILALRRQHLRTFVHNLAIGGRGVLVFDFVSSQSLPGLMQIDENRLNQALVEAINAKNFFTGLNPFAVQAELKTHADFAGMVDEIRLHPPWRWDIGMKQFAVSAITFRRM